MVNSKHFELLVVFVNRVCDFNGIVFYRKGGLWNCLQNLDLRFLSYMITIFGAKDSICALL